MAKKLTQEEFIQKVKEVHGDRYDYSKVEYINYSTKICIICHEKDEFGEEHGEFWVTPGNFLKNRNCPKCSKREKLTKDIFIKKARSVHGDKYDYSKVNIHGVDSKVTIVCPIHGPFEQTPYKHIQRQQGCPTCGNIQKGLSQRFSQIDFLDKARHIHGWKYDYSKVEYNGVDTKVCIICPIHGEFWQTPYTHINQQCGCPSCKSSKLEDTISELLNNEGIIFEYRKRNFDWLEKMELDFYIPELNLGIECQGKQHFQPVDFGGKGEEWARQHWVETMQRDDRKRILCAENGVKLLYYSDLDITYPYEVFTNKELLLNEIKRLRSCI